MPPSVPQLGLVRQGWSNGNAMGPAPTSPPAPVGLAQLLSFLFCNGDEQPDRRALACTMEPRTAPLADVIPDFRKGLLSHSEGL